MGLQIPSHLSLPLPFELAEGRYVIIRWKSTNSKRSSFSFAEAEELGAGQNLLLHYNLRFECNTVVRNSHVNGSWGREETDGGMPFKVGLTSEIKLVARADFFECFVDEVKHVEYKHRLPMETAKFLILYGDGQISYVAFGDEAIDQAKSMDGLATPYETPCKISPGRKIYICGTVDADVNRFWTFLCADDDYAFVLTVKMKKRNASMNIRVGGNWKAKQKVQGFPFDVDQPFTILIEVEADKFRVSVNGTPFAEFKHRVLPLSRINKVRVNERAGKLQLHHSLFVK